ncbi:uncharacterized protein BJ171DRAFT_503229 [Polychytrium aggregatum]|uniref:uncharacterized protein n=1 Tax=Polychytrium aggregatum TaxID=110093 RepID=UPI0022FEF0D1|nr:uncharacterized protein BJ171DRAFT_503229 [Polychytrium aggregatum]KAI9205201.1 hypothetical protein BJ171DRAFT_503229 [Polychytrium aggregatum]
MQLSRVAARVGGSRFPRAVALDRHIAAHDPLSLATAHRLGGLTIDGRIAARPYSGPSASPQSTGAPEKDQSASHADLNSSMGGVFQIPVASSEAPEAESIDNDADSFNPQTINLKVVLPSDSLLERMRSEKYTSLTAKQQRTIAAQVKADLVDSIAGKGASQSILVETVSKGEIKDALFLAKLLSNHSKEGQPLGFHLYQRIGELGEMEGEFRCAQLLSTGYQGQKRDLSRAMEQIQSLAERGHAVSQYLMGESAFKRGDSASGLEWIQKSADNGYPTAYVQLGHLYRSGHGSVPVDQSKAFECLKKGSELGVVEATYLLGIHYQSGLGTAVDAQKSFECFQSAAHAGLSASQHNLGAIYFSGQPEIGVERDLWRAMEYWKMAATQGFQQSQMNLGRLYLEGSVDQKDPTKSLQPDWDEARLWFDKAAKGGDPTFQEEARLFLGMMSDHERSKVGGAEAAAEPRPGPVTQHRDNRSCSVQ